MKRCADCHADKPLTAFYTNRGSTTKDKRHVYCKPCHRMRNRRYRETARLTVTGRAGWLLHSAKSRAKASALDFSLSRKWLEERLASGVCEVTGVAFAMTPHPARTNPLAPSIDRMDNTKGYTEDNCRVVVWAFNAMRNEFDEDTVALVAAAWLERRSCRN